jgi:nitronate monooxygenase
LVNQFYCTTHLLDRMGVGTAGAVHGLVRARHRPDLPDGVSAWRTVWSGSHSTGLVQDVPSVVELVERLERDLADALAHGWRSKLAERLGL